MGKSLNKLYAAEQYQNHDFPVEIATHWGIPHVEARLHDLHMVHQYSICHKIIQYIYIYIINMYIHIQNCVSKMNRQTLPAHDKGLRFPREHLRKLIVLEVH